MDPLILIGYFAKKVVARPEWLKAPAVAAIRSAGECSSPGPPNWIEHWTHNDLWVYSTIAAAIAVVPPGDRAAYELQAYRLFPVKWHLGVAAAITLPPLQVEPLPSGFVSVGFDPVAMPEGTSGFGCSPLSCNHMAEEIATNEHCLLDELDTAKRTACEFSRIEPEPGPYYVVEILRRAESA